jgi:hypothetical protein
MISTLRAGQPSYRGRSSSPKHPSRIWGKPNPFTRHRDLFLRRHSGKYMELTPLNNMPSFHIQIECYLYLGIRRVKPRYSATINSPQFVAVC